MLEFELPAFDMGPLMRFQQDLAAAAAGGDAAAAEGGAVVPVDIPAFVTPGGGGAKADRKPRKKQAPAEGASSTGTGKKKKLLLGIASGGLEATAEAGRGGEEVPAAEDNAGAVREHPIP